MQWTLSYLDTIGTKIFVLISEASLFQGKYLQGGTQSSVLISEVSLLGVYLYKVGTRSSVPINLSEVSFKRGSTVNGGITEKSCNGQ